MTAVSKMNKTQLQNSLRGYGEEPPKAWDMTELRHRLLEIEEERGITRTRGRLQTPLQELVTQLNVAAKKKSSLQQHCRDNLEINVTGNETMEIMRKAAMEKIYQKAPCSDQDPMGFGEHSSLTYEEVKLEHPGYVKWAIKTVEEGPTCARLARFVRWLKQPPPTGSTNKPIPKVASKSEASSSSSRQELMLQETHAMMAKMVTAINHLKEEVDEMKEERPRKKKDEGSFTMLTEPEG
eukprot:s2781_g9.t1